MAASILYFSSKSPTHPEFSNFWHAPFVFEDIAYKNVEEAFQAQKAILFKDKDTLDKIRSSKTPASAKSLGRKVQWFDKDTWMAIKRDKMRDLVLAKFQQNPALAAKLLATGDSVLAEATRDSYWGIGVKKGALEGNQNVWGHNYLGKILMEVRKTLKEAS